MTAFLIFFVPVAIILDLCLCIKAGLIVADWTEDSGFMAGFYLVTVVGLISSQLALLVWWIG